MTTKSILLPIDLTACPSEVFRSLEPFAHEGFARVTLLNVIKANVACPENRLYDEMAAEAEAALIHLAENCVPEQFDIVAAVRWGKPAVEIVTEARDSKSDLILMTNHRQRAPWFFRENVLNAVSAHAPCPVKVIRVGTRFNCLTTWEHTAPCLPEVDCVRSPIAGLVHSLRSNLEVQV